MLYELLTGALPFEGEIGEILIAHLTRMPVPPRERNPNLPPEWEALCLRMMEKSREARFQSVTQLAHALEDLRGHAAAYEAARVERADAGRSGHTQILGGPNDIRETLRVDVGTIPTAAYPAVPAMPLTSPALVTPSAPAPVMPPIPMTPSALAPVMPVLVTPSVPVPVVPVVPTLAYASFDPRGGCAALVEDPRHAAFARTLMSRAVGRWFEVAELCQTAGVAQPATLPLDLSLFVSWLEHPYPDPSLAAVVFLSLRTGWSAVVLCARAR
jgi:hypothetical protein